MAPHSAWRRRPLGPPHPSQMCRQLSEGWTAAMLAAQSWDTLHLAGKNGKVGKALRLAVRRHICNMQTSLIAPGRPPFPCQGVCFYKSFPTEIPRRSLEPNHSLQPPGCGVAQWGPCHWDRAGQNPRKCTRGALRAQRSWSQPPLAPWRPRGVRFPHSPEPFLWPRPWQGFKLGCPLLVRLSVTPARKTLLFPLDLS